MASVSPQHLDELTSRLDSLLAKISSRTATTLGKAESRAQKLDVVTLDPFKGSGNLPRVAKRPPVPVQAKAMSLNLVRMGVMHLLLRVQGLSLRPCIFALLLHALIMLSHHASEP